MTHDTTRENDDGHNRHHNRHHDPLTDGTGDGPAPDPDATSPASDEATVPFTPLTAIPVPNRPSTSNARDDDDHPADTDSGEPSRPDTPGSTTADSGAAAWFSKLRAGRGEPAREPQIPDTQSTPDAPFRFSSAQPEPASTPESAPLADTGANEPIDAEAAVPARRIVFHRKRRQGGVEQEVATFLGVDGTRLSNRPFRIVLGAGAALILIALLANNAGLALTVLSAIVPMLLLIALAGGRNGLASDSTIMLAVNGLGGVIAGGVIAWIAARLVASSWFDEGVLNFGAAGFGGRFAHAAGNAGWLIWLVVGIVLPIVALAAALALPVALHRSGRFQETTGDGRLLGAAAGAGFAIGTAAVFWSPLNLHDAPGFTVSDWTLMVIGIALVQPVVVVLALAALGAAVWRYLQDRQIGPAILPVACGLGGMLLMRLGSIWIQPRQDHLWLELCWTLLVAAGVVGLYRLTTAPTSTTLEEDRR